MTDITFDTARNGCPTCSVNGVSLHSRFDPVKESERYIQVQDPGFTPTTVAITGACMCYCIPSIHARWPQAQIITIQYTPQFSEYDRDCAKVFLCTAETTPGQLAESLFAFLGEEEAFTTLFLPWEPGDKAWPAESQKAWESIKTYLKKARDVTGTRNWFNRRWLKNTVRFFSLANTFTIPGKTSLPVIVCASGPTLETAIPVLQQYRDRYFLIALSSALSPLSSRHIIPDAILSTDGGWWATCHLRPLLTESKLAEVPLWITSEAAVPSELLSHHPIQYLTYNDVFETYLQSAVEGSGATICPLPALRNGTVSGTALHLALLVSDNQVFFCGLDLKENKGHQHTQPNILEMRDASADGRTASTENRTTPRTFASGSLALYRDWFSTRHPDTVARCIRIISPEERLSNPPLGAITDKDSTYLESYLRTQQVGQKHLWHTQTVSAVSIAEALRQLESRLQNAHVTGSADQLCTAFLKAAALPEYLMANRDQNQKQFDQVYQTAGELLQELIQLAENLENKRS